MYTVYRMNADELSDDFLESVKRLFPHKTDEIAVTEAGEIEHDETAYLLADQGNRARLLDAIENVSKKKDLVTVDLDDLG